MVKIKSPTLEELQKVFFPDGTEQNAKSYGSSVEGATKMLLLMKAMFKCENCGNCCRECAKGGIALSEQDYDNICNYLGISHKEFKRRYKHKFKRDAILIQGDENCPFYNNPEKKCDIYEIKPHVCNQYPFTGSNIKKIEDKMLFVPCIFCYPYLLSLYSMFENTEFKEEFNKKIKSLPEEVRKKILVEGRKLAEIKIKEGFEKIKRDEA